MCTDNSLYSVNPVYTFIEPNDTVGINIVRQGEEAKLDNVIFLIAEVMFPTS